MFRYSVALATFQVLNSYMGLVATQLEKIENILNITESFIG